MSRQFDDWYFSSGNYTVDDSEWVPVDENPRYLVCREGFVKRSGSDKVLIPHKGDGHGHLNVRLSDQGVVHERYIHRLVAKAFVPNPNNYQYVRHLDDDPTNNCIENLAWGTQLDNHNDCVRNGNYRRFTDTDREKHLEKQRIPIYAIGVIDGERLYFSSATECSRQLGIQQSNIWKVLHGQRKQTGGYIFEYAPKGECMSE